MDTTLVNHLWIACSLALLGGALVLACIRVEERPSRRGGDPRDPLLEDLGTGYAEPRPSGSVVDAQPPADLFPRCGCGAAMIAIDWDSRSGRANEWHCPPCVELAQTAREDEVCAATIRGDMGDEDESPWTLRSPGITDGLFGCDEGRDA